MAGGFYSPFGGGVAGGSAPVSFTSAAPTTQVDSDIIVECDWDNDGDFSESVEDITSYVMSAETRTGRDFPSSLTGETGVGRFKVSLNNDDDRFSLYNADSPLNADPFSVKTGRKIRVRTSESDNGASLITYVGAGTKAEASNASVSPSLPSGIEAGDLLLVYATIRNSGTGTVTVPGGWHALVTHGNTALLGRYALGGGEDTAPTIAFASGVANATTLAHMVAFRGTSRLLASVALASSTQLNASAADVAFAARTVTEDDCAILALGWKQDDGTSVAPPAGFTEMFDSPSSLGDDAFIMGAYQIQTTATNISAGSFTVTGGASAISRGMVVVLTNADDRAEPELLARDRFERGNQRFMGAEELGTTWVARSGGGFSIRNNAAQGADGYDAIYGTSVVSTVDVGTTDMYAQVAIPLRVQDGRVGLVVRYLNSSNHTRVFYDTEQRGVVVEDVSGGVVTDIGGVFNIEPWDGMTLGVRMQNQIITTYIGGTELQWPNELNPTRTISGTHAGIYGRWEIHSDVPPSLEDFYVWDKPAEPIDGILWTGRIVEISGTITAGDLKVVEVSAEGPLGAAARVDVPAPRIGRIVGEHNTGTNHSVPAGAIVGDIMARAGILHPPHPIPAYPLSNIGAHAAEDGSALQMARDVEITERGFIYETKEGQVAFQDRFYRDTISSSGWFSDQLPGTGQFSYSAITPLYRQQEIFNRVRAGVSTTTPTVVSVENQFSGFGAQDIDVVIPDTRVGDLVLVFIMSAGQDTGSEWMSPSGWDEERSLSQAVGARIFSRICDGSESGATVRFYDSAARADAISHIYVIRDWYGSNEGIKVGRVDSGVPPGGNDPYPLTTGWGREPSLFIVFQAVVGSTGGILWGPLDTPPPVGYDYLALEGLVSVPAPGEEAYAVGVESVYKTDVTDSENARPWVDVFDDFFLRESLVVAVRGYAGPVAKTTDIDTQATLGDGNWVEMEDIESQNEYNVKRSNPSVPRFFYTRADAEDYCEDVLEEYSVDRPIPTLKFFATKTAGLRKQARNRQVSDKITLTAMGNSGVGIEGDFFIESVSHRWSAGTKLWETEWELSPSR